MKMLGKEIASIQDMKHNFSIDELMYVYYSGELKVFLENVGEIQSAAKLEQIPHNAWLLVRLYELFDLNAEDTEETIRNTY